MRVKQKIIIANRNEGRARMIHFTRVQKESWEPENWISKDKERVANEWKR